MEAPDGSFAAYCGMWYEARHRIAYVEPVCTDPDYRRMGLGVAVVLEGIRRCGAEGATVAFVGSEQPFYLAMGFEKLFDIHLWTNQATVHTEFVAAAARFTWPFIMPYPPALASD